MKSIDPQIVEKLRRLRLEAFVTHLEHLYETDPLQAAQIAKVIGKMADDELANRAQRAVERRIREAQFIRIQTIDKFDFDYNPSIRKIRKRYLQLVAADMVEQGLGAIFVGNSGLGKTHLARALGYAACQRAQRVLFVPCSTLVNRLVSAEATKDLEREIKKLQSPAMLIIDELGYITMSHEEANLFFQVISRRHDHHRPCVVTTNRVFKEWNQVFRSNATAHVIMDRLTERAEIFYLEGKSYRETHRSGIIPQSKKRATRKSKA